MAAKEITTNVEHHNRYRENAGCRCAAERTGNQDEEVRQGETRRRTEQQGADVIAIMKRAKGATLAEIQEATRWQKHTIAGSSRIVGKKSDEKVESSKNS